MHERWPRCFDCLQDFPAGADRFMVLKKLRDLEMDGIPVDDPLEAKMLDALLLDPVAVCEGCAGWYGEHPIRVTEDESLGF